MAIETQAVEVALEYPIRDFGKELHSVTLSRRMNAGDMRAIDAMGDTEKTLVLIERLCGLSRKAVDAIDVNDLMRISEALAPFLPNAGPTTGDR